MRLTQRLCSVPCMGKNGGLMSWHPLQTRLRPLPTSLLSYTNWQAYTQTPYKTVQAERWLPAKGLRLQNYHGTTTGFPPSPLDIALGNVEVRNNCESKLTCWCVATSVKYLASLATGAFIWLFVCSKFHEETFQGFWVMFWRQNVANGRKTATIREHQLTDSKAVNKWTNEATPVSCNSDRDAPHTLMGLSVNFIHAPSQLITI